ncbi:methyl-accepting chemotaxis protein [Vreelandella sulfidaeris]|uniref:Methyl-accepting chemotaxis protein n=2 Tax=Vreelandella sulfidaeris TaxID=115553 RepID=A0A365TJL4_9GAMM|nr:methyl-accepting chemotaxis protein [Halomonas sulfidaeris]RBI65873.1 methyl-accepting chemotaxis protein [Halomonas sulfidaeris]
MSDASFANHIARTDRLMWLPLGFVAFLCLVIGIFTQTLLLAVIVATITLPLAYIAQHKWHGHIVNGFVKATIMMAWAAVLIEQSGGLIEAHFSIFILLSVLILYSDWRVIAFGGLVIALHHALFTWLHYQGVVQLYASMGDMDSMANGDTRHSVAAILSCLLMHGGAVVVQVIILGYLAKVLESMVQESLHVTRFAVAAGGGNLEMTFTDKEQQLPAVAAVISMRDQVTESLRKTQTAASHVTDYSQQLFVAQEQLRTQTARNSSQTERISTSTAELAATTRETAEESQHIRQLASHAEQIARQNGAQVEEMREMMRLLNQHASKIHEMLSEIDNITFQTNLLALNASVEAARAGEHGLGFAVVANEVRTLSKNTHQTASRIRQTIADTTEQVSLGVSQTTTIAETTQSLIQSFEQVAMRLTNMDNAVQQQHQGVEELEQSVNEIYNALELSRDAVDNSHSMAEQLSETADTMMQAVSGFVLPVSPAFSQRVLSLS